MPIPTTAFATDEEVCLRALGDFDRLRPADQLRAGGNDGAFSAGDRWTLASASAAAGLAAGSVEAGMVARISLPGQGVAPDVQFLAVASASSSGLALRRLGEPAGVGQPPGPAAGATNLKWVVATMKPQLLRATFELDQRFGIDEAVYGARTADLYDPDELKAACVLTVLWKLYQAEATTGSPTAKEGDSAALWTKAAQMKSELDEVLARLDVKFTSFMNAYNGARTRSSNRFGTRITR